MQRGRHDHFSPQGYLRGFIHPKRLKQQKPVWVFSIERREWRERSTASFGWEKRLYDYPDDSVPDGTAEKVFLRPENDLPIIREQVRSNGFSSWNTHRESLVKFAAMLSARSPMFLDQAAGSISDSLVGHPRADVLAHNYALTTMRSEADERYRRWRALHWVLRFTSDPKSPVIACDQSVGMDG